MTIDIITLFPEYFQGPLHTSILGKAIAQQKITVNVHALREFGVGKHQLTDDRPFGGGPGMVMLVEPIDQQLQSLGYRKSTPGECIALTSAKGAPFTQPLAQEWSELERLCLICGHYEGVDERVAQHLIDKEIRIGEYVLTGGEPAVAVMTDAVARLLPSVLGNSESLVGESHHAPGVLGYPQYSRPAEYKGWNVPEVLLSGNHEEIAAYREHQR
jgi:tRNA (guanine37-N1)-methyltransferase